LEYNNYTQRGVIPSHRETVQRLVETFPHVSRLKVLRMGGDPWIVTAGPVSDPVENAAWRAIFAELRLGHRRVQGNPGSVLGHGRTEAKGAVTN